jgi:hypothetical protein
MVRGRLWTGVLFVALAVTATDAGCHLIYPFGVTPPSDGAQDGSSGDLASDHGQAADKAGDVPASSCPHTTASCKTPMYGFDLTAWPDLKPGSLLGSMKVTCRPAAGCTYNDGPIKDIKVTVTGFGGKLVASAFAVIRDPKVIPELVYSFAPIPTLRAAECPYIFSMEGTTGSGTFFKDSCGPK